MIATMTETLKITNLHVSVEGKPILNGVNLDDPAAARRTR